MDINSFTGTNQFVKKLVQKEQEKNQKYGVREKKYKKQKDAWMDIRKHTRLLFRMAQEISSPVNSAFRQKNVNVSNEKSFSATANRLAKPGKHHIEILEIARFHKVQSDPITQELKKHKFPKAVFEIYLGREKAEVNFSGGSIEALSQAIHESAKELVTIDRISISENDTRMILSGKKGGKENLLRIKGGEVIFTKLGFLGMSGDASPEGLGEITQKRFTDFLFKEVENQDNFKLKTGPEGYEIVLGDKTGKQLLLKKIYTLPAKGNLLIQVTGSHREDFKRLGLHPLESGKIHSSGLLKIEKIGSMGFGVMGTDAKGKALKKVYEYKPRENDGWIKMTPDLKKDGFVSLSGLTFFNRGNGEIRFKGITLPADRKDTQKQSFKNVVTRPSDLKIKVNDIKMGRNKNDNINDIIPGVSISVKQPTSGRETLEVKNNPKPAIEKIEQFLAAYNALVDKINLYGGEPKMDEEKKEMVGGEMRGDSTLMRYKYALQNIIIGSYPTSAGETIAMLAQLGIGTAKRGTGYSKGAFSGTVQWVEGETEEAAKAKIRQALSEYPEAVHELFVNDRNKDGLPDTGVAFLIKEKTQFYMRGTPDGQPNPTEGPIVTRIDTIIRGMADNTKQKERAEKRLVQKERDWKGKFNRMNQNIMKMRQKQERMRMKMGQ